MKTLTLIAPAKVNLTLEVLSRRADGYHELRSVVQAVSLHDTLTLRRSKQFYFACDAPALAGEDNLVVAAYRLLAGRYALGGAAMELTKRVPWQSGLGGGSADCAAALRGLSQLFGLGLGPEELCALGARLGADVPACLTGGALVMEGVGERLTPLPMGGPLWMVIVMPPAACSTADLYRRLDERPYPPARDDRPLREGLARGDAATVAAGLRNCFEPVLPRPGPILEAKAALREAGALGASMTGSGAAVFGVFTGEEEARKGTAALEEWGHRAYCCRSIGPEVESAQGRGSAHI